MNDSLSVEFLKGWPNRLLIFNYLAFLKGRERNFSQVETRKMDFYNSAEGYSLLIEVIKIIIFFIIRVYLADFVLGGIKGKPLIP